MGLRRVHSIEGGMKVYYRGTARQRSMNLRVQHGDPADHVFIGKAFQNAPKRAAPGPKPIGIAGIWALRAIRFMCMTFDPMMPDEGDLRSYEKGFVDMGSLVGIVQKRLAEALVLGRMRSLRSPRSWNGY
jgi:hypothetical protein